MNSSCKLKPHLERRVPCRTQRPHPEGARRA